MCYDQAENVKFYECESGSGDASQTEIVIPIATGADVASLSSTPYIIPLKSDLSNDNDCFWMVYNVQSLSQTIEKRINSYSKYKFVVLDCESSFLVIDEAQTVFSDAGTELVMYYDHVSSLSWDDSTVTYLYDVDPLTCGGLVWSIPDLDASLFTFDSASRELNFISTSESDVGTYSMTVRVALEDYPSNFEEKTIDFSVTNRFWISDEPTTYEVCSNSGIVTSINLCTVANENSMPCPPEDYVLCITSSNSADSQSTSNDDEIFYNIIVVQDEFQTSYNSYGNTNNYLGKNSFLICHKSNLNCNVIR